MSIEVLVSELFVARKGSVKLTVNLDRRLLSWKESNRWNRNFSRSLSSVEVNEIRNYLNSCDYENWIPANKANTSRGGVAKKTDKLNSGKNADFYWSLLLLDENDNEVFSCYLTDETPDFYKKFVDVMSHFCRRPFVVNDA